MSEIAVSVLVPLFNKALYVRRCLDSIFAQTFPNFEVIVVDDGSTDQSADIAGGYRDPRLRLIRQDNAGPGAARNRAAAEARGEWLAPLDADDAWDGDYLARSVQKMSQRSGAAALFWAMKEEPSRISSAFRWKRAGVPNGPVRITPQTTARFLNAIISNTGTPAAVIRRDAFEALGGFYDKDRCLFAEDAHLWLKLLLNYEVLISHDAPMSRYCDSSELAVNWKGVRPIEPFLLSQGDITPFCPPPLRHLLRSFLALRACKTASILGYFGEYRAAGRLVRGFVRASDWRLPWFFAALLGCTPAARWAGAVARTLGLNLRAR